MNLPEVSRRTVLKISLALSGLLTLTGLLRFLGYQPAPTTPTRFNLRPVKDYLVGSVTSIPSARTWLLRDERGLYAMSAICTHLGCTANHAGLLFECPCHGSQFNEAGEVLHGPARQPLGHVELTLSPDDLVVLDTTIAVPSTQRLT